VDVFINKWLHLLSVIGTLGGLAFAWHVLRPGSPEATSPDRAAGDAEADANPEMWKRFGMAVGILWIVVLLTGFYNYYKVSPTVVSRYHMFAGMKMGLAILMFVLTMLIAHPAPGMAAFRRNRGPLLVGILILGVIVVGLSAHLNLSRISGDYVKPAASAVPAPDGAATP
jgi:uncharacterized membrane protein